MIHSLIIKRIGPGVGSTRPGTARPVKAVAVNGSFGYEPKLPIRSARKPTDSEGL